MADAKSAPADASGAGTAGVFPRGSTADSVLRLLLWVEPVPSAVALGCGLLFAFLIEYGQYSAVTLLSYLCLLQLLVCFLYVNAIKLWIKFTAGQKLKTAPAAVESESYVSVEWLSAHLTRLVDIINPLVVWCINACRCTNNVTTLKAIALLFAVSQIGRIFSGAVLFAILYAAAFALPKLYQTNKPLIDQQFSALVGGGKSAPAAVPASGDGAAPPLPQKKKK